MAAALQVIDVQEGLDDPSLGERNNPEAEANIAVLLADRAPDGARPFHGKSHPLTRTRH